MLGGYPYPYPLVGGYPLGKTIKRASVWAPKFPLEPVAGHFTAVRVCECAIHDQTSCLFLSATIQHPPHKPPVALQIVRTDRARLCALTVVASPDFRFDARVFLTRNGIVNIVRQLGPNTKNLDKGRT